MQMNFICRYGSGPPAQRLGDKAGTRQVRHAGRKPFLRGGISVAISIEGRTQTSGRGRRWMGFGFVGGLSIDIEIVNTCIRHGC